jgi:hypothetical protein
MQARVKVGWIDESALAPAEPPAEEPAEAEAQS